LNWLAACLVVLVGCTSSSTGLKSSFVPPHPSHLLDRIRPIPKGNGVVDHFALLIGANTEYRHQGNLSLAYQVLIEEGYKRDNVFILDVNTGSPIFPKTETTSRLAVYEIMRFLRNVIEPHDTLLVYVTGHGAKDELKSNIMLNPSQKMGVPEFVALLRRVKPKAGMLFMDQCYAGYSVRIHQCNWYVVTVATDDTTSQGTSFPRYFWDAFRQGAKTVQEAFESAHGRDEATKKGENQPKIWVGDCVDPNLGLRLYK